MNPTDPNIFSHPQLIELLRKMQEAAQAPAEPYQVEEDGMGLSIYRRRPLRDKQQHSKEDF